MIRKISKKREKELEEYNRVKQELFLYDLKAGRLYCFLSNIRITIPEEMRGYSDEQLASKIEVHHINGKRENEHLFDPEEMKPVIREYHTLYHNTSIHKLIKMKWFNDYMTRISKTHPDLWRKEQAKFLK